MCGIAGFWSREGLARPALARAAARMAGALRHRGPDGAGVWVEAEPGIALGHQRLAIVDLSEAGAQPMVSHSGRYVISYNGEIYNHQDLRARLGKGRGGGSWRGHSDTETLLAAIDAWGLVRALEAVNGMFAFALWDRRDHTLALARDRMGEKPLYYGHHGQTLLFGSELKALAQHPGWAGEIDRQALTLYLRYGWVPTPWSIYRGIAKLPPAHYVTIRGGGQRIDGPHSYWRLKTVAESGVREAAGEPAALTEALEGLISDSIHRRLQADVPLGAFLSGGFDSTAVAALMQAQHSHPVKTFSIGFHEPGYNEADHAAAVAEHLGTDHTQLYVSSTEAREVIPHLPQIYDEPFADPSQIPTYLVSKLTRREVTVALSGDGGDELLAGYNRHRMGPHVWSRARRWPGPMRRLAGRGLERLGRYDLDGLAHWLSGGATVPRVAHKLEKVAAALGADGPEAFYKSLTSHWKAPASLVRGAGEPMTLPDRPELLPALPGLREQMLYLDMKTYLPDDILTKVDRASMAVSLEARVPLLDHRLVEFAWRVPSEYKQRDGQGKWLLRRVLDRHVPRRLMERPKMGFGLPIGPWLRGPLRDWAESLLAVDRLEAEGFLEPAPIRRAWREHQAGRGHWEYHLWNVLMFQAWLEEQRR